MLGDSKVWYGFENQHKAERGSVVQIHKSDLPSASDMPADTWHGWKLLAAWIAMAVGSWSLLVALGFGLLEALK